MENITEQTATEKKDWLTPAFEEIELEGNPVSDLFQKHGIFNIAS